MSRVSVKRNGVLGVNLFVEVADTKPTTSTTTSTSTLVNRHTVPLAETWAMTRFGVICPTAGLRLDVGGISPHG